MHPYQLNKLNELTTMNNIIETIALRRGIDLPSNIELQFLFGKPQKGEKISVLVCVFILKLH